MLQRLLVLLISLTMLAINCFSQNSTEQLEKALNKLQQDEQFKHAIVSLYVVASKTGKPVFEKNAHIGLAVASCQKVVTSAAAFELLGNNFTYKTIIGHDGEITDKALKGSLYILGSGDPTTGSWRWKQTGEKAVLNKVTAALASKGIQTINGSLVGVLEKWDTDITPGGWTWEDMGNYYGAGASGLNWRENQYDLVLKAGKTVGEKVDLVNVKPMPTGVNFFNELRTGVKGSGDNAYVYLPPYTTKGFLRGTIPAGENNFVIAGSFPDPANQLLTTMLNGIEDGAVLFSPGAAIKIVDKLPVKLSPLCTIQSPTLDSMNYWFLKKSINLYGEAFIKTIAATRKAFASTDSGIAITRDFWSRRGIHKSALKIIDGSGLSPANRVTTHALVTVMQYARMQSWFPSFYDALPLMNGIKMKDGYIGGVRGYTGYVDSKSGQYTFAFIVNNFDGSPASVREKMWKVLDMLK